LPSICRYYSKRSFIIPSVPGFGTKLIPKWDLHGSVLELCGFHPGFKYWSRGALNPLRKYDMLVDISLSINGTRYSNSIEPRTLLVHYLRDTLGLTGTHEGCDTSQCGACTVIIDGRSAKSCTVLAVQADGTDVMTIEGLAQNGEYHPLQEGFWQEHGLQCGFCTPGMIMVLHDFLSQTPHPTEEQIRTALAGNICRCTGYNNIVKAAQYAANKMSG